MGGIMELYLYLQTTLDVIFTIILIYLILKNKKLTKEIEVQTKINEEQQKELEAYIEVVKNQVREITYFDKF